MVHHPDQGAVLAHRAIFIGGWRLTALEAPVLVFDQPVAVLGGDQRANRVHVHDLFHRVAVDRRPNVANEERFMILVNEDSLKGTVYEVLKLPLAGAQGRLGALALRDVDDGRQDHRIAVPGDDARPVLQPDQGAVLAHPLELVGRWRLFATQARLRVAVEACLVAGRDDGVFGHHFDDLPRAVVPEDVGIGLVGEDGIEPPGDEDSLNRALEQAAEALLALSQRLLGALALGDVGADALEVGHLAVFVEKGAVGPNGPRVRAIGAPHVRLADMKWLVHGKGSEVFQERGPSLLGYPVDELSPDQLFRHGVMMLGVGPVHECKGRVGKELADERGASLDHVPVSLLGLAQRLLGLDSLGNVGSGAAISLEHAGGIEDRLAAGLDMNEAAVGGLVIVAKIAKEPVCLQILFVGAPFVLVPVDARRLPTGLADQMVRIFPRDAFDAVGEVGVAELPVRFPKPIGRSLGDIAETFLAGAQRLLGALALGGVVADGLEFGHFAVVAEKGAVGPGAPVDRAVGLEGAEFPGLHRLVDGEGGEISENLVFFVVGHEVDELLADELPGRLLALDGIGGVDEGERGIGLEAKGERHFAFDHVAVSPLAVAQFLVGTPLIGGVDDGRQKRRLPLERDAPSRQGDPAVLAVPGHDFQRAVAELALFLELLDERRAVGRVLVEFRDPAPDQFLVWHAQQVAGGGIAEKDRSVLDRADKDGHRRGLGDQAEALLAFAEGRLQGHRPYQNPVQIVGQHRQRHAIEHQEPAHDGGYLVALQNVPRRDGGEGGNGEGIKRRQPGGVAGDGAGHHAAQDEGQEHLVIDGPGHEEEDSGAPPNGTGDEDARRIPCDRGRVRVAVRGQATDEEVANGVDGEDGGHPCGKPSAGHDVPHHPCQQQGGHAARHQDDSGVGKEKRGHARPRRRIVFGLAHIILVPATADKTTTSFHRYSGTGQFRTLGCCFQWGCQDPLNRLPHARTAAAGAEWTWESGHMISTHGPGMAANIHQPSSRGNSSIRIPQNCGSAARPPPFPDGTLRSGCESCTDSTGASCVALEDRRHDF